MAKTTPPAKTPDALAVPKHLPTAVKVIEKWADMNAQLLERRREDALNRSFKEGQQWVRWDQVRSIVTQTNQTNGSGDGRLRVTVNKFRGRILGLVGRMTQKDLVWEAQLTDAGSDAVSGGRLGEFILKSTRDEEGWEELRAENIEDTLMAGTAAIAWDWDGDAGELLVTTTNNEPLTGPDGQQVRAGQVKLTALSIHEFGLDTGVKKWREANYWVRYQGLPPETVQKLFNLPDPPAADFASRTSATHMALLRARGGASTGLTNLTGVLTYYQRNDRFQPGGVVIVVGGNVVKVIPQWPPAYNGKLNIRVTRATVDSQKWHASTFVSDARSIQAAYNNVRTVAQEYARNVGNPTLLVPNGTLDDDEDMSDEPGQMVNFDPTLGKPEYLMAPGLDRSLREEGQVLEQEFDDVLATSAVTRGMSPGSRISGNALAFLAEKADVPLSQFAKDQAHAWSEIGTCVLELYAAFVKEKRKARVQNQDGMPTVVDWSGDMLYGQTHVRVPLDTTMPSSKVATQSMAMSLAQTFPELAKMGIPALSRMLEMPSLGLAIAAANDDAGKATRENSTMRNGIPCTPDTWDDHATHIQEHNRYRNSTEFESLNDDIRAIFELHVEAHGQFIQDEQGQQQLNNAVFPGSAALPQPNEPIGSQTNPIPGGPTAGPPQQGA